LGSRFRAVLDGISHSLSDIEVGRFLIERLLLVHVKNFKDKFNTLCLMIEKLYGIVSEECGVDNLDSVAN
jgi:DNA-directed RNA polymerase I subunit RPA2